MTPPPPSPSPRSFPCDHCHRNAHGSLSGRPDSVTYPKDVASGQPTVRYRYHLDGQLAKIDYVSAAMADVTYNYEA